jgi:hypothetical protein
LPTAPTFRRLRHRAHTYSESSLWPYHMIWPYISGVNGALCSIQADRSEQRVSLQASLSARACGSKVVTYRAGSDASEEASSEQPAASSSVHSYFARSPDHPILLPQRGNRIEPSPSGDCLLRICRVEFWGSSCGARGNGASDVTAGKSR